jgi:hypothetical protein
LKPLQSSERYELVDTNPLINNIDGEELKTMLKESRNGDGDEEKFKERNLHFIYMKREIASYTNMSILQRYKD